jgi:methylase of polypeptide subunit release factors
VTERQTSFGGLTISFDERVIQPRQWTVAQAHWAAELVRRSPPGPVLELCAGVGHIGLLTVTFEPRDMVMVDMDGTACDYARRNIAANRPAAQVDVRQGRLDEVLESHERFAGIIADPPWVPSREVERFPEDPLSAIDGGPDGLAVAWVCVGVVARHLAVGGWALLQLGNTRQAAAVQERLQAAPSLGLEVAEVREYDGRGVLVHLVPVTTPGEHA